jgi:hypothetical protein
MGFAISNREGNARLNILAFKFSRIRLIKILILSMAFLIGMSNVAQARTLELDGKIGETKTLPEMKVCDAHWGDNSSSQDEFVYEPPPGWIILSYNISLKYKFGGSWITPQLTSKNSNIVSKTQFDQTLSDLAKTAGEYNNYKAKSEIQNVINNSSNWSSSFWSSNNVLRIKWGGSSHEKKVAGITVDTDTASLGAGVTVTIARSLSQAELNLMEQIIRQRIKRRQDISKYFVS